MPQAAKLKEGGGGSAAGVGAEILLWRMEPMLEQVPPEGLKPMEGPTLEQGKGVRRKQLQRAAAIN